jgi:hypothetical protein
MSDEDHSFCSVCEWMMTVFTARLVLITLHVLCLHVFCLMVNSSDCEMRDTDAPLIVSVVIFTIQCQILSRKL